MPIVDYTESISLQKLAMRVVEKYSIYMPHVDVEDIVFLSKEAERLPKSAKTCQLVGVGGSWIKHFLDNNIKKHYALEVWEEAWRGLSENEQAWLVFTELYSMDKKRNGKLRKPNVQEFDIFVELLGPYWRKTPDVLPVLLGDDLVPLPMPQDDTDEGETQIDD